MTKHIWFKRKWYGWGWYPSTWQGWVILLAFLLGFVWDYLRIYAFSSSVEEALATYLPQATIMLLALIFICYETGESPRWQWGRPKGETK